MLDVVATGVLAAAVVVQRCQWVSLRHFDFAGSDGSQLLVSSGWVLVVCPVAILRIE
ncbi:hypothetical protein [Couchioplanes caeruleus]|uniref:hypothetical protein n=1 Tax=Couchioplanes caeruleus TaxID=56438 RepID=UPI001FD590A5|nr:hypothetical protein [Couchioplanes caeruleus]